MTSTDLSELLAALAEHHVDQRQRALRRASRTALAWPEEAAELPAQDMIHRFP